MITTAQRDELHHLVDLLPANTLDDAARALRALAATDPFIRALLNAPEDDEPLTPQEQTAIAEGLADVAAGRLVPLDEARRRLLDEP